MRERGTLVAFALLCVCVCLQKVETAHALCELKVRTAVCSLVFTFAAATASHPGQTTRKKVIVCGSESVVSSDAITRGLWECAENESRLNVKHIFPLSILYRILSSSVSLAVSK
jgi:hypothetical protein